MRVLLLFTAAIIAAAINVSASSDHILTLVPPYEPLNCSDPSSLEQMRTTRIISSYVGRVTSTGAPRLTQLPASFVELFSRCGLVPVHDFHVDDTDSRSGGRMRFEFTRLAMERLSARAAAVWSGEEAPALNDVRVLEALHALSDDYIKGRRALVVGSMQPWHELLLLEAGAVEVVSLDYATLVYDHPLLRTMDVETFARGLESDSMHDEFGVVLSVSSLDHDGLGRYGDPLSPDADLLMMDKLKRVVTQGRGVFVLSVPVGKDAVYFNLMRRYGPFRLPLLLDGWKEIQRFGWDDDRYDIDGRPGAGYEPVFALQHGEPRAPQPDHDEL